MNDHNSQLTTVCSYIRSANILFQLCNCTILVYLSDKENICTKIVKAREQEKDILRQHSPITNEIFTEILNNSQANALQDSFEVVMCDFLIIIQVLGLQVSRKKLTCMNTPSRKQVIKAFTPLDWIIYNKNNAIINKTNTPTN